MATRITKRQADKARSLIQVEKICLALQRHIEGTNDLKPSQINAARILLDKSLPSLTATAVSADDDAVQPMLKIVRRDAA